MPEDSDLATKAFLNADSFSFCLLFKKREINLLDSLNGAGTEAGTSIVTSRSPVKIERHYTALFILLFRFHVMMFL